jgi:hypothetical protein
MTETENNKSSCGGATGVGIATIVLIVFIILKCTHDQYIGDWYWVAWPWQYYNVTNKEKNVTTEYGPGVSVFMPWIWEIFIVLCLCVTICPCICWCKAYKIHEENKAMNNITNLLSTARKEQNYQISTPAPI